jgi:cell division protein ZapA
MNVVTEQLEAEVETVQLVQRLEAQQVEPRPPSFAMPAAARSASSNTPPADVPVTVDIYDQTYHLRGQDPAYIDGLAEIVDSKMRAVAAGGTTVDSLRVAVLAALNIADELMRAQARYRELSSSIALSENTLRDRTASLSGLLDSILTDDRKLG